MRNGALVLSLLLAAACAGEAEEAPPDVEDPAAAAATWDRIHELGYRSFPRPPGHEDRTGAEGPHGTTVDIFVNDAIDQALDAEPGSLAAWPDGSIIVKDAYDGSNALELVAVVEKAGGEWVWTEFDGQGTALFQGAPRLCTGCHAAGSDFVLAFDLP